MKRLIGIMALGLFLAPLGAHAHDYVSQSVCTTTVVPTAPKDCARVDTDTEFEDGAEVGLDGDDSNPRGDDISDGYVQVVVGSDGKVTVYCEDEGHYNTPSYRPGGDDESDDESDEENPNDVCEP